MDFACFMIIHLNCDSWCHALAFTAFGLCYGLPPRCRVWCLEIGFSLLAALASPHRFPRRHSFPRSDAWSDLVEGTDFRTQSFEAGHQIAVWCLKPEPWLPQKLSSIPVTLHTAVLPIDVVYHVYQVNQTMGKLQIHIVDDCSMVFKCSGLSDSLVQFSWAGFELAKSRRPNTDSASSPKWRMEEVWNINAKLWAEQFASQFVAPGGLQMHWSCNGLQRHPV